MYEWKQAGPQTWYMESPAKVGLVVLNGSNEVILIDSGSDRDAGRRIRKYLDENQYHLKAIYNTHSNADHIGGNAYLQKQTGCKIYAPGIEADFTRHPLLEPSFLYGGYPVKEMRNKFLMAQPSTVEDLSPAVLEDGFELLDLPGHFFDMKGIRTPDNIVFAADCVSSRDTLEKYRIGFIYDVQKYLETLDAVTLLQADLFIPAHAEPAADMKELALLNRENVENIARDILEICRIPKTMEQVLAGLFERYGLQMDPSQYLLCGSTVRSFLSWLKEQGKLQMRIQDHYMFWTTLPETK